MDTDTYRFTLELFRQDGTSVGQVALDGPLAVDWAPAEEWVRFLAIRRDGRSPAGVARESTPPVEPVWHAKLGQPYVQAFRVSAGVGGRVTSEHIDTAYLRGLAERAAAHFVAEKAIAQGDRVVFVAAAYPRQSPRARVEGLQLSAEDVSEAPPLREGRLTEFTQGRPALGPSEDGDFPVFVSSRILDEAAALARRAGDCETGGVLVGRLWRDPAAREVFAEVTAQVPARHTAATAARLTFTHETWTDVRAAIALRRSDELMLGWWHSHPVRVWCRECPPEKQAACSLARGFFSEHDRALHRTMFPAAYGVGLLVNDLQEGATFSLFGWRRGLLAPRGFSLLGPTGHAVVTGDARALTECDDTSARRHDDARYRTA